MVASEARIDALSMAGFMGRFFRGAAMFTGDCRPSEDNTTSLVRKQRTRLRKWNAAEDAKSGSGRIECGDVR